MSDSPDTNTIKVSLADLPMHLEPAPWVEAAHRTRVVAIALFVLGAGLSISFLLIYAIANWLVAVGYYSFLLHLIVKLNFILFLGCAFLLFSGSKFVMGSMVRTASLRLESHVDIDDLDRANDQYLMVQKDDGQFYLGASGTGSSDETESSLSKP